MAKEGYDLYKIEDFSGGMNTQIRGIDLASNESVLLHNAWVELVKDERGSPKGIIHKRKGYAQYNSTALAGITSIEDLIRYRKNATSGGITAGTKATVLCGNHATNNEVHKLTTSGNFTKITQATTQFAAGAYMMMCPFKDYLFITDGTNRLQAYPKTATTSDDLIHTHGAMALPRGRYLAAADGRLFVSGGTSENYLWFSETGLYATNPFTDCDFSANGTSLNFIKHPRIDDGDSITGLVGTYDDDLLVGRQHDVTRLLGNDEDDYRLQEIENYHGFVDQRAVAKCGKYIIWVSKETDQVILYDGNITYNIGDKIESYLKDENFTGCRAVYYSRKRLALFSFKKAQSYNDYTLVYHVGIKELTGVDVWAVWDIGFACYAIEDKTGDDGDIYAGDSNTGKVHQLDTGTNDNAGNIAFKYHSPHLSLGLPNNQKIWRGFTLGVDATSETPFTVTNVIDLLKSEQQVTAFHTEGFPYISEVMMGVDYTGPGDYQTFKAPSRNGMRGVTQQIKIESNDKNDLTLYRMSLKYRLMPTRDT